MKFNSAYLSKPGKASVNSDGLGSSENSQSLSCWVLADGRSHSKLGNHTAQVAVDAALKTFEKNPAITPEVIIKMFESAQHKVTGLHSSVSTHPQAAIATLCAGGRSALWAHLGNVRIYLIRNGTIIKRTEDHSQAQSLVETGELNPTEFNQHPGRRNLLKSLGRIPLPMPSLLKERLLFQPGDCFLICSDGFWEKLGDEEILIEWCKSRQPLEWLEHMEMRIVSNPQAEIDSYSAIALWVEA